jgi:stage II sporulation protein D
MRDLVGTLTQRGTVKMKRKQWSRELQSIVQHGVKLITQHPMKLIVFAWIMTFLLVVTVIPMLVVNHQPQEIVKQVSETELGKIEEIQPLKVAIYLTKEKRIEVVPLEQYIRGVLAAEMPIDFELEALKAQAIAARTYIIRRYVEKDFSNVPVAGAWVTDTVSHQVYLTEDKIEERWNKNPNRAANLKKLNQAIEETKGLVITYSGHPILASFFSTSNGYTENSEDYWTLELPYLRSVESPWEEGLSPKYKTTKTYSKAELLRKLEVKVIPASTTVPMKVIEMSDGNRIKRIQVGDKILTGRDVRERLGLGSSQFTWRSVGNTIEFTIYGNGHGVGMSQWGAQGMAIEGRKAQEIIAHYYKGVNIEKIHSLESIL